MIRHFLRHSPWHSPWRARRGASLTGYALVVGLIAVVAIAATTRIGEEITELFGLVGEDLDSVADGAGPGGSGAGDGSGDTANQPPAAPALSASQIQENSGSEALVTGRPPLYPGWNRRAAAQPGPRAPQVAENADE